MELEEKVCVYRAGVIVSGALTDLKDLKDVLSEIENNLDENNLEEIKKELNEAFKIVEIVEAKIFDAIRDISEVASGDTGC